MGRKARARAVKRREGVAPQGRPASADEARVEGIISLGRDLLRRRDPVEVEISVSGLLGQLHERTGWDLEARESILHQMFDDAVRSGDRGGLAILHGLAALLHEPHARIARAGIMRLRSAGIADPQWAESIGRYEFRGGWSAADDLGDQELVIADFEAENGTGRHAVTFMVDANFDGLVRQASVAGDAAAVRRAWESAPEAIYMPIVERTAQEVADRLGPALDTYDRSLDPPCDEDVHQLAELLRARLRLLPVARERERPELGQADRDMLLADFARSKEAGRATVVRELVSYFVDYKADYSDGDPIRWSPIAVELCLVDWFPRKITMDRATQRRVPDALRRWVRYAAMRRGLRAELLAETLDAIDRFEPEFLDAMNDEGRAGPAKALVSAMQREGVDLTDEAAVERWIGEFNQRPLAQRDLTLGSLNPLWPVPGEGASDHPEANGDPFPGDAERRARRAWSVPQGQGSHDGIDLALLDRSDPDDRRILIEAEHPELHESLDEGLDLEGTDGITINPEMHIALHEVLANQLWVGEPPEAWEAAQRLIAQGHDRHEILHQLMRVVSDATFDALQGSTAGEEANARMRVSYRELSVSEPRRARKASQR